MAATAETLGILRLLSVPGVGPAKVRRVLSWATAQERPLVDFFGDPAAVSAVLSPPQVEALEAAGPEVEAIARRLEGIGAHLLSFGDAAYPQQVRVRLGDKAPPLLAVLGNPNLLEGMCVGFCGSRAASEKGLATARDCADQLARVGVNIVSGYALGVDMVAHTAALEAGGRTVLVLAEGILNFRVKREIKDAWDPTKVVVASEFLPGLPWSVHNAMQRNRTICGLSGAMVLIEAGERGGSLEAGRASLAMGVPLFAAVYEGMPAAAQGNRLLLRDGARQLFKSRSGGRANVGPILEAIRPGQGQERHSAAS